MDTDLARENLKRENGLINLPPDFIDRTIFLTMCLEIVKKTARRLKNGTRI